MTRIICGAGSRTRTSPRLPTTRATPSCGTARRTLVPRATISPHPCSTSEPIPSDLVTNSGSGFDPHISPAAAEYQVERLAKNTGKTPSEIRAIIEQCTEQPQFGILGDARVNVLKVNLMLDGILQ